MISLVRAHRRAALYAALALAVPLPAFALSAESGPEPAAGGAPVAIDVTTTLDGCGLAKSSIVCTLDVSYGSVEGATSFTASVTAPTGVVTDYGDVGPGGTTVTVPYAGNGTYSVRITAYGTPPGSDEPAVLGTAESKTSGPEERIAVRGDSAAEKTAEDADASPPSADSLAGSAKVAPATEPAA